MKATINLFFKSNQSIASTIILGLFLTLGGKEQDPRNRIKRKKMQKDEQQKKKKKKIYIFKMIHINDLPGNIRKKY